MPRIATLITALAAAVAFASHAEAHNFHGSPSFYASPFFRDQGRPRHMRHCEAERQQRMQEAFAQERAEKLEAMRGRRAAAAAANRRARLAAIEQRQAEEAATAQNAAQQDAPQQNQTQQDAPQQQNAPQQQDGNAPQASTPDAAPVANTADSQPVVTDTNAPAQTAAVAQPEVCRKYSAAADGLIDAPCN